MITAGQLVQSLDEAAAAARVALNLVASSPARFPASSVQAAQAALAALGLPPNPDALVGVVRTRLANYVNPKYGNGADLVALSNAAIVKIDAYAASARQAIAEGLTNDTTVNTPQLEQAQPDTAPPPPPATPEKAARDYRVPIVVGIAALALYAASRRTKSPNKTPGNKRKKTR